MIRKIKVTSDGTPKGMRVIDVETGEGVTDFAARHIDFDTHITACHIDIDTQDKIVAILLTIDTEINTTAELAMTEQEGQAE